VAVGGSDVFADIKSGATLYVPAAALAAYKASAQWLAYFSAANIVGDNV
jgi:hypothetical protein